jgi:hypothetical protein
MTVAVSGVTCVVKALEETVKSCESQRTAHLVDGRLLP